MMKSSAMSDHGIGKGLRKPAGAVLTFIDVYTLHTKLETFSFNVGYQKCCWT